LFKYSITCNTLLQVNATIIAGILVFTSLVSLRILALEFDVTPTIQMIKGNLFQYQILYLNVNKDTYLLLNEFLSKDVLDSINKTAERLDT
jgi:hypothetical protein